ncbi:membrane associated rhomboid family serine protease [Chitinophaga polysaccharea]|uniref:Membrane associated rhomboid family serine protease n=1 Tax=Chitinophaga polysaccharea TaxID=1293035 RepID=A0A561Q2L7_9BACT|nr:rhomboid family intramembrane serine protease [Chitinophaga polysaccharea]TWF44569.1 membrane associated rhomboid family serine protease [Chitinophaga polysaccharea]
MHALEKEKLPRLSLGEGRNMVTQLLVANLTIFIFLLFTLVIYKMEDVGEPRFHQDIMTWLRLPGDPAKLLTRPWTLVTSLFTHIGVWQVFTNMVWLWCFGTFMQHLAGHQRILPLYLFGGICGNLFYVAAMQLIPSFHALAGNEYFLGASGSIMAIAIGVTAIAPRYRIFPLLGGGISLWIVTLLFISLSVSALLMTSSYGYTYLPVLAGGGLAGWLYMWQWKKGSDWGAGFNRLSFKLTHVFHPASQQINPDDLKKKATVTEAEQPFRRIGKVPEQKLNEILDKINENGLASLSPEERETLLRASRTE